ncbi:MAG: tetratricopeptide repeat protein, partial [Planctomycetota bacterium]|nr:tetratricopeptide repeat protein [Planctomycetota bacterium]
LLAASDPAATPFALTTVVEFLARHRHIKEAEGWLGLLEKMSPDTWATLVAKARLLRASDKASEIAPLLVAFIEKNLTEETAPNEQKLILLQAARLSAEVGLSSEAESYYRKLSELVPEANFDLANYLAVQGRLKDAVQTLLAAKVSDEASRAIVLCSLLSRAKPDQELSSLIEPAIATAQKQNPQHANLALAIGTMRYLHGDREQAIQQFRHVLKIEPDNVLTLNNLANLLSETPAQFVEALQCIQKAIQIQGPRADLLDTLGVVLLRQDKVDQAIQVFRQAVEDPAADARFYFHLALAYQRKNQLDDARVAMVKANDKKLSDQPLTLEERTALQGLTRVLQDQGNKQ